MPGFKDIFGCYLFEFCFSLAETDNLTTTLSLENVGLLVMTIVSVDDCKKLIHKFYKDTFLFLKIRKN